MKEYASEIAGAFVTIVLALGSAIGLWRKVSKTRTENAGDTSDRKRLDDYAREVAEARKEAHDANNRVIEVQRQLGNLEAENRWCRRENEQLSARIDKLEAENAEQALQIQHLLKKKTFNPSASDLG